MAVLRVSGADDVQASGSQDTPVSRAVMLFARQGEQGTLTLSQHAVDACRWQRSSERWYSDESLRR